MELIERVRKRIPYDEGVSDEVLMEYIDTVSDRLCLRLGVDILPRLFESICVDAVVKMHRRVYYEGISSEGTANITTSFVDNILAEYALPLVKPGGTFIAMKGAEDEAELGGRAIQTLGGKIEQVVYLELPNKDPRNLVVIKKLSQTSPKYPRRAKKITSKPL